MILMAALLKRLILLAACACGYEIHFENNQGSIEKVERNEYVATVETGSRYISIGATFDTEEDIYATALNSLTGYTGNGDHRVSFVPIAGEGKDTIVLSAPGFESIYVNVLVRQTRGEVVPYNSRRHLEVEEVAGGGVEPTMESLFYMSQSAPGTLMGNEIRFFSNISGEACTGPSPVFRVHTRKLRLTHKQHQMSFAQQHHRERCVHGWTVHARHH